MSRYITRCRSVYEKKCNSANTVDRWKKKRSYTAEKTKAKRGCVNAAESNPSEGRRRSLTRGRCEAAAAAAGLSPALDE